MAVLQLLGQPDPFRLRYRLQLRTAIAQVVRDRLGRRQAADFVASWANENIAVMDRQHFVEIAEIELASLHEGNFARYQIRPSEFAAWSAVWQERS